MGIEPTSEAWEAYDITQKHAGLAAFLRFWKRLNWKIMENGKRPAVRIFRIHHRVRVTTRSDGKLGSSASDQALEGQVRTGRSDRDGRQGAISRTHCGTFSPPGVLQFRRNEL